MIRHGYSGCTTIESGWSLLQWLPHWMRGWRMLHTRLFTGLWEPMRIICRERWLVRLYFRCKPRLRLHLLSYLERLQMDASSCTVLTLQSVVFFGRISSKLFVQWRLPSDWVSQSTLILFQQFVTTPPRIIESVSFMFVFSVSFLTTWFHFKILEFQRCGKGWWIFSREEKDPYKAGILCFLPQIICYLSQDQLTLKRYFE